MNHIHTEGQTDRQPKEYKEKVKKDFGFSIFSRMVLRSQKIVLNLPKKYEIYIAKEKTSAVSKILKYREKAQRHPETFI